MLFYGPPGTGKTSTILALSKQLYGPTLFKSRVLELNASDERGISIVREKIKNFARLSVSNASKEDQEKYPCPPYKLIILDEADSMTSDAQSALRRTMETYSNVTRFCLICNYITRIIDPLASRCSKFRFKPLGDNSSLARLQYIVSSEKIKLEDETKILKEILKLSEGDLRKAITFLQSACKLFSFGTDGDKAEAPDADSMNIDDPVVVPTFSITDIQEIAGVIPNSETNKLIQRLVAKNFNDIFDYLREDVFKAGYNGSNIINSLHDSLVLGGDDDDDDVDLALSLNHDQKNKISEIIFAADSKLTNGCNEQIQVLDACLKIAVLL
ncbi:unnamed protein product [Kuraishia capsulata CBS 1993]|uniref:AAA+ ATPase domain-containing protein n=1 Tax=Kuraishia capsulata CBS 1993 TaxID=1382522 RepID=W6MJB2_9ASCO|nr:uncharacterized protein KUCA_T00002587001 [Kuraishia capsulata CBS 1993]CDK26614.1 unnamed protein product [Kuraishia capsulata CBS 1993]